MEGTEYKTKEDVLRRAQEAIGIPLGDIDQTGRLQTGKGAIGTVLEESWFGYSPNSESEPDFPEAKVELKATPYLKTQSGIRAKERLVCNIINYMTEYQKTFPTSDFWHKCETILIMSYEHRYDVPKGDYTIDKAVLFSYPEEDLIIIEQDWEKIIGKVRAGEAHLITEGDTLYLAACTKGTSAASVRQQPFSDIPAKQRAYSLKSSYMTKILNSYIFGAEEDEHIITDWHILSERSFEDVIIEKLRPYYGQSVRRLASFFGISTNAKNANELLLSKMLGIEGRASKTAEFQKASIVPKTIRVQSNGRIKESMSFPAFKFTELIKEDWETSTLREMLEPTKFMFVIFKEDPKGESYFERVKFWNIPAEDLEEIQRVWQRTVDVIRDGVELNFDGNVTRNNLPKQSESRVAHVRPHARDMNDVYPLPDGRMMPKQCFWLNNTYIEGVVNEREYKKASTKQYQIIKDTISHVAEESSVDIYQNRVIDENRGNQMGKTVVKNYPSPRLMETIGATNQKPAEAIGELVANSFDARLGEDRLNIIVDMRNDMVAVIDNGKGMTFDVLEKAVCIAEDMSKHIERGEGAKGHFGMGFKTSCSTLGRYYEIFTRPIGEDIEYHVGFDISDYSRRPSGADAWDIVIEDMAPALNSPLKDLTHGTAFVISRLKDKNITVSAVLSYLGEAFKGHLETDDKIFVVDSSGSHEAIPKKYKFIPGTKVEIDEIFGPNNKYRVTGWMALDSQTHNDGLYGFNIYRHGQLVEKWDKSWFRAHLMTSRIIGEVNMDFLDATFYKQGVQQSEDWEIVKIHMKDYLKPLVAASNSVSKKGNINNPTELKKIISNLSKDYDLPQTEELADIPEKGLKKKDDTQRVNESIKAIVKEQSLILEEEGEIKISYLEKDTNSSVNAPFDYIFSDEEEGYELQVVMFKAHPLWQKKVDSDVIMILATSDAIYRVLVEKLGRDTSEALKIRNEWINQRISKQ